MVWIIMFVTKCGGKLLGNYAIFWLIESKTETKTKIPFWLKTLSMNGGCNYQTIDLNASNVLHTCIVCAFNLSTFNQTNHLGDSCGLSFDDQAYPPLGFHLYAVDRTECKLAEYNDGNRKGSRLKNARVAEADNRLLYPAIHSLGCLPLNKLV